MSGRRVSRCPRCEGRLRPEEAHCRLCGLVIHDADEVQAELISGPIEFARPQLSSEPLSGLEQAMRSWAAWAAASVYVVGVVLTFWLIIDMPSKGQMPLVDRLFTAMFAALLGNLVPAGVVWLVVDSIQATWAWWGMPTAPELQPRLGWLAGPARLGALVLTPILGGGMGCLIYPTDVVLSFLIGGALGLGVGMLLALAMSVVVWHL